MSEPESLETARQAFADQFEASGESVLYRRRGRGEPQTVSVWERDALIFQFNRRVGDLYKALMIAIMAIMVGAAALAWGVHLRPNILLVVLVLVPTGLGYAALQRWIWDAPVRLIAVRTTASAGPQPITSPEEEASQPSRPT